MPDKSRKSVPPVAVDPDHQRWLTVEQSAAYIQVSAHTLRNIIRAGDLRAVRLGYTGPYHIDRADLDQFMTRRKKTFPPYRKGTRPWVRERHAKNRKRGAK